MLPPGLMNNVLHRDGQSANLLALPAAATEMTLAMSGKNGLIAAKTADPIKKETIALIGTRTADPISHETNGRIRKETIGLTGRRTADPIRSKTSDLIGTKTAGPIRKETSGPIRKETIGLTGRRTVDPIRSKTSDLIRTKTADPTRSKMIGLTGTTIVVPPDFMLAIAIDPQPLNLQPSLPWLLRKQN
jgi:hypothetical protein